MPTLLLVLVDRVQLRIPLVLHAQRLYKCVRTVERIILHVFLTAKDTEKGAKSVFLFATY